MQQRWGVVQCAAKLRWLGARKDTSVQGLEGGVQLCTRMGIKARECTCDVCVRLNREAMFCINWVPKQSASGQNPRPKVRLGMSR